MPDNNISIPLVVIARVALLRAGGMEWAEIAGRLNLTVTQTEAMPDRPGWDDLYRLAARTVAQEAEAEARLELRRALRSADEDEAMAAAEEVYRRQERRSGRRKSGNPAPDSSDEQLVQAYLECLNAMPVEEFLALELKGPAARDVVTPGPSVTPSNDRPTGQAKSPPISS